MGVSNDLTLKPKMLKVHSPTLVSYCYLLLLLLRSVARRGLQLLSSLAQFESGDSSFVLLNSTSNINISGAQINLSSNKKVNIQCAEPIRLNSLTSILLTKWTF